MRRAASVCLALSALALTGACGNRAAERKIAAHGEISVQAAPPAPADFGQGDNTGSPLAPGTTRDPPTSWPDQTGGVDEPVTTP